jgi:hypothetical protein
MSARASHRGKFFAIDSRIWARVIDCGMNEAATYLVLACGTGGDNRTTRWSCQAVHRYSGIAWSRAKAAIENLVRAGFVRLGNESTKDRPRYELMPHGKNKFEITENFIWLPNTIVTGTGSGESSPLARIRGAGEKWTLRLFVDLYAAQNLREDGGIHPGTLCEPYERKEVGERGYYTIWAFRPKPLQLHWNGPMVAHRNRLQEKGKDKPLWESIGLLRRMGLLEFIPHLMESDSPQAEPIHPLGVGRKGEEQVEAEIGAAADAAGRAMCPEWAVQQAEGDGFELFCPVPRTLPLVQLLGVPRLRYRPHTKRTAAWYANLQEMHTATVGHYSKLGCGENSDLFQIKQA